LDANVALASENALSLFFLLLLLASVGGQSFAGWRDFNAEQLMHQDPTVTWAFYVTSSSFWAAVMENWQSQFLHCDYLAHSARVE
jgi:hypothetical protein